ncbi:MAG: ABC transporter substrate-binding protein [Rhodobacteraceae bacterium]|nr:ABC transporter substrate-binding protein [Paracoccaceae bacterium]
MPLNNLNRRTLMIGAAALAMPMPAFALNNSQARTYVQSIIDDVMETINSSASEARIMRRFRDVFTSYADIPTIARLVIGAPWRSLSGSQRTAFSNAFGDYLSWKYGRQFRSYRGSTIRITRVVNAGRKGFLVYSTVQQAGGQPFSLDWQVSDGSGRTKMIDMIIEGISLISSEREEIRARLASVRGDINALTAQLRGS